MMNEDKNTNEFNVLKKKIHYFFENKIFVHVTLHNNWFHNGYIIEESADFFILEDREEGKMPLFFLEIDNIEPYKKEVGR